MKRAVSRQPSAVSFLNYQSPFSWRYGSEEMRSIWSEVGKRRLWRRVWCALAEAQAAAGLVSRPQLRDLKRHADDIDIARALKIEAETKHDLVAELRTYAGQCRVGGGVLHLGATSMDIEDNADALRIRTSLDLAIERLRSLLKVLAARIRTHADTPTMAFTHLQPAEPTTIGYRLACYGQDLMADLADLTRVRSELRGKGFKGAVGTSAGYAVLLAGTRLSPARMEAAAMKSLGLDAFPVTGQVYPRSQDHRVVSALSGLAATLHRFAFDLRILQSPPIGEWSEPFAKKQVGSSAMPFKRNPVASERIDSLARHLAALNRVAWENAALNLLERTLDDSANRRIMLPEAFLAADEILAAATKILQGLVIDARAVRKNLERYGPFAGVECVLMELAKKGADRQEMHERLREHSMTAWEAVAAGRINPLAELLSRDPAITRFVSAAKIPAMLDATHHTGDAGKRARAIAGRAAKS